MKRVWLSLAMAGVMAFTPAPRAEENIDTLIEKVKPTLRETEWKRIPWSASVKEAKTLAAATGKPIFVFRVDGDFDSGRC